MTRKPSAAGTRRTGGPVPLTGKARCGIAVLAALLAGCGPEEPQNPVSHVTLVITSGGRPVPEASVQLVAPGEGRGAFGHLDEVGSITFPEVEPGRYTVVVLPPAPPPPDPENPAPVREDDSAIPDEFRNQTTSPLTVDVPPGEHSFQFDLYQ